MRNKKTKRKEGAVANYLLNEYGDYKNDDVDGVMFKLFKVEE